jgi:hypothetical protein
MLEVVTSLGTSERKVEEMRRGSSQETAIPYGAALPQHPDCVFEIAFGWASSSCSRVAAVV